MYLDDFPFFGFLSSSSRTQVTTVWSLEDYGAREATLTTFERLLSSVLALVYFQMISLIAGIVALITSEQLFS